MNIIAANTPKIAARSGGTEGCIVVMSAALCPIVHHTGPFEDLRQYAPNVRILDIERRESSV
jgi:hypothetical protein